MRILIFDQLRFPSFLNGRQNSAVIAVCTYSEFLTTMLPERLITHWSHVIFLMLSICDNVAVYKLKSCLEMLS